MEENELKACPVCGQEPELIYISNESHVTCKNDDCPLWNGFYSIDDWQNQPRVDALTAEVAALRARVAELEAEARWVSVTERLPDEEGYYIVLVSEMGSVRFGDWETRGVFECIFRDGYWFTAKDVIAWRPLPAPPEAE